MFFLRIERDLMPSLTLEQQPFFTHQVFPLIVIPKYILPFAAPRELF